MLVRGSCHHDCPDTCMWEVTVTDGRAVALRGSAEHPLTAGQLCPKVNRYLDRVYHPDRILTPLVRTGPKGSGRYTPIGWDEAEALVADRLGALIAAGRAEAILPFSFDGTQGVVQKGLIADRFFDRIGASDVIRHLCGSTAWMAAADVTGTPFGVDPERLADARTIVLWGTDTALTNRHLWPVIDRARVAGATVVVIDPVRTATARRADRFLQVRPGTDAALVLGLIHVMERDGLLDRAWIEAATVGWEELQASAAPWAPDTTAEATGVAAADVEWLAHTYATQRPAVVRTLVGPEHRAGGRELLRAVTMLPAVTGAWRDVGGGLARSTQVYFETALALPTDRPDRRSFNMARLGQVLTDQSLDPPIEALVVHNANPAVIVPDQNRVVAGLERDDLFTVVIEQVMTDTARYADVILPATTQVEHLDLGIAWGHLYLSLNQPAIAPLGQARPNSEIFRRLARALGVDDDPMLAADDETVIRRLLASGHPWLDGISYERLAAEGWARLAVPADHRPHLDPDPAAAGGPGDAAPRPRFRLGAVSTEVGPETPGGDPALTGRFPLALMSRKQHPAFLNANYGGSEPHFPQPPAPRLHIHPLDAAARGVGDGDRVRVHNDRGSLTITAHVGTDGQPGLVTMPFGWWHRSSPEGRAVNALTNPAVADDDQGSAFFHETLVEVEPV
ncbi:MAG: molybdopterin-dependent oxidoreductase [Acidimicrobiales bacterium]